MTLPQLIILEGPDAAGKTTLARHLARSMSGCVFRCTWTSSLNIAMADYQQNVLDNARWSIRELCTPVILDRHWPSEWVYGQVFRSITRGQISWMMTFAEQIRDMGGVYIFCSDETKIQKERHQKCINPEHPYKDEDYTRICGLYFEWWRRLSTVVPIYRYSVVSHGDRMDQYLHDFLSDTESRSYFPAKFDINPHVLRPALHDCK